MSLINEALKKAQRQRAAEQGPVAGSTGESQPMSESAAGTPAPHHRRRKRPAPAQTIVLMTVGAVILLLAGGATTFIFLAHDSEPARHASAPQPATPAPAPETTPPAPAQPATPAQPESAVVVALPVPVSTPAPAPVVQPVPPVPVAAVVPPTPPVAPVTVSPSPATPAPVAPAATVVGAPPAVVEQSAAMTASPDKPNPEVHLFLEKLRVTGIRASQNDPRVLMNDRMYRLNDLVDARLQLRLTGISNLALTFTDANGQVYTHDF